MLRQGGIDALPKTTLPWANTLAARQALGTGRNRNNECNARKYENTVSRLRLSRPFLSLLADAMQDVPARGQVAVKINGDVHSHLHRNFRC